MESLANFLEKDNCSWQKMSATLEAAAKIYGYRVDFVHTEIFRFVYGLNKTKASNQEDLQDENKLESQFENFETKRNFKKNVIQI
jgi:hypothetical protein